MIVPPLQVTELGLLSTHNFITFKHTEGKKVNYLRALCRKNIKYAWVPVFIFSLVYFYRKDMFFSSPLQLRIWLEHFGILAPMAYIILYTLRPILFIPSLPLNLIAAALFGPVLGTLYILIGGLGSATLCYYLGKYSNFEFINKISAKWWYLVDKYTPVGGSFKKMLCLRLVPVFPYDPVSFLAGLSDISYGVYALATLLGMLPGAIAYNFLVNNLLMDKNITISILGLIIAFGLPYFYWQLKIKHAANK